jgi:hypothetical protein
MKTNTRGYEHQRLLFSALRNDQPANAESKSTFAAITVLRGRGRIAPKQAHVVKKWYIIPLMRRNYHNHST